MSSPYTIYAFFNAEEIRGVLNAVAMMMGSTGPGGDYLALVKVAAMIGVFIAVGGAFVRHRGEDAAKYVIMLALFYCGLFLPRVTVNIEERGAGAGTSAVLVVDNVPLGLAFFASTTSHIGAWMTEQTETFFSLPDTSLRLSGNGMLGGARAIRESMGATLQDPILGQDVANFMRECINPELVDSPSTMASLLSSTNIIKAFEDLSLINPGRIVSLVGVAGIMNCKQAFDDYIKPAVTSSATGELARIARILNPGVSVSSANAMFGSLLPAAEGLVMTASASTQEAIMQRMMLNQLNETSASLAQVMNDPAGANTALATAMAASSANSSYQVMARLARETLPLIRSSIELVILGVFPIIFLLIVIAGAGGGTVIRSYVMMMLWCQLWAPLYAIVNYVGTMAGAKSMKAALAGIDGVAVSNAAALLNTTISHEAIAGILTIGVPVMALALVKGGEVAMSSMASSLTAPADRAAAAAGAQIGAGNVSMGNVQWGNYTADNASAHQSNTSFRYTDPSRAEITTPDGTATFGGALGGETARVSGMAVNNDNLGVTSQVNRDKTLGRRDYSGGDTTLANTTETGLTQGVSAGLTHGMSSQTARALGNVISTVFGGSTQDTSRHGGGETQANKDSTKASRQKALEEGFAVKSELAAGGAGSLEGVNALDAATKNNKTRALAEHVKPGQPGGKPGAAPGQVPMSSDEKALLDDTVKRFADFPASRVGLNLQAKTGFGASSAAKASNAGGADQTSDRTTQIQKAAEQVLAAVYELKGSITDAGQRQALDNWASQLVRQTNATYGTSLRLSDSERAGNEASRNIGATGSVGVNYGPDARAAAEGLNGDAFKALHNLNNSTQSREDLAGALVPRINHATDAAGQKPMEGPALEAPTSRDELRNDGKVQIADQRERNDAAAEGQGRANDGRVKQERQKNGVPDPGQQPSLAPAAQAYNDNQTLARNQIKSNESAHDRDKGITLAVAAVREYQSGSMDAMLNGYFAGFGTLSNQEAEQRFKALAKTDQGEQLLIKLGQQGSVSKADLAALNEVANRYGPEETKQPFGEKLRGWVGAD